MASYDQRWSIMVTNYGISYIAMCALVLSVLAIKVCIRFGQVWHTVPSIDKCTHPNIIYEDPVCPVMANYDQICRDIASSDELCDYVSDLNLYETLGQVWTNISVALYQSLSILSNTGVELAIFDIYDPTG